MKSLRWDVQKSEQLKTTRGVSFEELIHAPLIAVKQHPKRARQRLMLFDYKGYIWVVPFVEDARGLFLKTLFPSRQYTRLYRGGEVQ